MPDQSVQRPTLVIVPCHTSHIALHVQMFPSGTLVKADAIYEVAANGIADVDTRYLYRLTEGAIA